MKYRKILKGILIVTGIIFSIYIGNWMFEGMTPDHYMDKVYLGQIRNYLTVIQKMGEYNHDIDVAKVPFFEWHKERLSNSSSIIPQKSSVIIIYNPDYGPQNNDWIAILRREDWRNSVLGPMVLWSNGTMTRNKAVLKGLETNNKIKVYLYHTE